MKYKHKTITNLIIFSLSVLMCFSLMSCGGNDQESSVADETLSSAEEIVLPELSVETALELVKKDKLITEIFVCNSLYDKTNTKPEYQSLSADNPYCDYSVLQSLLDTTYADDAEKEFFLSYPLRDLPAVKNMDGKTNVFYHLGSGYADFADEKTITVSDGEDENSKIIGFKTSSGKEISLNAVYVNENWYLEKGIFNTNSAENVRFDGGFIESGKGSLQKLSGKILVIEFFVEDKVTKISDEMQDDFHEQIYTATQRIAHQVSHYTEKCEFVYDRKYFLHENELGTKVIEFDIMFAETGFGTLKAFAEANYDLSQYDGYVFAVCMNKDVRTSVALCDGNMDTENYFGERMIISPKTTALEIYKGFLQIAGAYDYNQKRINAYAEELFKVYFPNDSVVCDDVFMSAMSPVTAYSCGAIDDIESIYRIFIPKKS